MVGGNVTTGKINSRRGTPKEMTVGVGARIISEFVQNDRLLCACGCARDKHKAYNTEYIMTTTLSSQNT